MPARAPHRGPPATLDDMWPMRRTGRGRAARSPYHSEPGNGEARHGPWSPWRSAPMTASARERSTIAHGLIGALLGRSRPFEGDLEVRLTGAFHEERGQLP